MLMYLIYSLNEFRTIKFIQNNEFSARLLLPCPTLLSLSLPLLELPELFYVNLNLVLENPFDIFQNSLKLELMR